jgi:hypothetical protein
MAEFALEEKTAKFEYMISLRKELAAFSFQIER